MDEKQCATRVEQHDTLWEVVFGNEKTNDKGMKQKVDEMHEMLVQAKGLKNILGILISLGAAFAIMKGWFNGN